MKKLVVLFSILIAASTFTFAQQNGPKQFDPEARGKFRADRMKENLGLSEDQYKLVLALNTKQAKERQEMMLAHREVFNKQNDAFKNDLGKVLNKEQMEKFEANQKAGMQKFGNRSNGFSGNRQKMNGKGQGRNQKGCDGCCQKSGGRQGRGRN